MPKTFSGYLELTRDEWLSLLPFFLFVIILLYLVFSPFLNYFATRKQPRPRINRKQKLEETKVVHVIDIEDIGKEKTSFCRCWKSKKVCFSFNGFTCLFLGVAGFGMGR